MSFLLDTNIVSEWAKPRPNAGVVAWLAEADEDRVFVSVVTVAEVRRGMERLPAGRRRDRLEEWLSDDLPLRFEGRILAIDLEVADAWGKVVARRDASGRPMAIMDAFVAATAEVHKLTLVTRNSDDFEGSVRSLVNPWSPAG